MEKNLTIDRDLGLNDRLYRYITLESFLALLETKQIALTNINLWDDQWEAIISRASRMDSPGYSFYQNTYGQCWSQLRESDAMWRIYSPSRTGIQISTSVERFKMIDGFKRAVLGKVIYLETIEDWRHIFDTQQYSPYNEFLYKRAAFKHEQEVRILINGQHLNAPNFEETTHISLPVDLSNFIEGVTVDPRAGDWYVDAITRYCERAGLTVTPAKSDLYAPDPHRKFPLRRVWVPKK